MNHRGVEVSTLRAELPGGCVAVLYNTPDMRAELVGGRWVAKVCRLLPPASCTFGIPLLLFNVFPLCFTHYCAVLHGDTFCV